MVLKLHIPGRPCSPDCPVCNAPRPNPEVQDVITAQMKQDLYESERAAYREAHPHLTRDEIEG